MGAPDRGLLALRSRRQGFATPLPRVSGYEELFRRLQPVSTGPYARPGSPPHLPGRTRFDDRRAADRLRVGFPQVARFTDALPPARLAWLRALCLDTQLHWQLVRFGIADDCVRAEVDLSGVPRELAAPLFRVAVEALAVCVKWVLPAFSLIVDPDTKSETLDRGPWWEFAEEVAAG